MDRAVCIYLNLTSVVSSINFEEPVTVITGGDVTELNITGLIPYPSYTLYVEGVTVEIGEKSDDVLVKTLEDGEGVMGHVCVYAIMF